MAISKSFDDELDEVLAQLAKTNVDVIYIADSLVLFILNKSKKLTDKYLKVAQKVGKK